MSKIKTKKKNKAAENARKITEFLTPKNENCSVPQKCQTLVPGAAIPGSSTSNLGPLHCDKSGENRKPVKTDIILGENTQPTNGISLGGLPDWTDGTRCTRLSQ